MLLRKILIIVVLVCFGVMIVLPPLLHGYVYPNSGDDTAFHLVYIDAIKNGEEATPLYYGQVLVGYPVAWLSNVTNWSVDQIFLWFNYALGVNK